MVVWSALSPLLRQSSRITQNAIVARSMSGGHHRTLPLQPSRWQWNKFKDLLHFYILLGVIPLGLLVTGVNIFVGPATLSEIPEGYVPKYWEYCKNPITRFFARYCFNNPQQDYEKFLHHIYEENERRFLRMLDAEVKAKMAERHDYKAYYYRPVLAKYHRVSREAADYLEAIRGD